MNVLADIVAGVRADLERRMSSVPLADVKRAAGRQDEARDPLPRLRAPGTAVIAEVKRSSPSQGSLAGIEDPAELARGYECGGACAISVLTEHRRFGGSLEDLRHVRAAVDVPVLRKDFVVTPYQVWEARAHGADMVLLMAVLLQQEELVSLIERAVSIGLTPLVECHTAAEVDRALQADAQVIGINARDLTTLKVHRDTFSRLAPMVPTDRVRIAESGVRGPADVLHLAEAGADAVLVGTSLVSGFAAGTDPSTAVADLVAAGVHPATTRAEQR
jgi:indole-3-glycerol phosphate synthase